MPMPKLAARFIDATLALLGVAVGFVRDFSEDFHWHLVLGNWTLAHHALMRRDVLSHTFTGQRQHLDYWLADVALALAHRALGLPGAYLLRGLALAVFSVLLAREGRRLGLSAWAATLGPALWLGELAFRAYLRPETFTFALLAGLLVCLGRHEPSGERRFLWVALGLVTLWANVHGSVGIGLLVVGCYAAERAVRTALSKPLDRRKLFESLALPAAAFVAACVNPEGLREPLMFLQVTASDPTFQAGIDWRPLSLATMSPLFPVLVLVIVVTTALAGRRVSIWRAAACAVLLAVALAHARFVKTALIVAIPLVASNLVAARERFAARFSREHFERGRFALLLVATFGTSFLLFGERRLQRELGLGLDPGAYPEAACRFAREHPLPGEMLNALDFGSYLLFCLPSHRTYIDQRAATLFTPDFSREYRKLPEDRALFERRLREHRVGFAFVAYDPLAKALAALPDWNLVYVDDLAQIYVRSAFTGAALPSLEWLNPAYLPSLSSLHGEPRTLARTELERQRRSCPGCRITALFGAALGTPEEAERFVAGVPSDDDDPNVALLRGLVLLRHGDLPRAVDVFNACLERSTDPIGVALWIDRALGEAGQSEQRRVLRDAVRSATAEGLAQKFALAELQGGS